MKQKLRHLETLNNSVNIETQSGHTGDIIAVKFSTGFSDS